MATAANGQLLALSGPRNPYPGKLGVLEEGAYADLLLVDGNPLENIALIANPDAESARHHERRQDLQERDQGVTTMPPIVLALIPTVLLLVWMGFFMMGSLPLLVLKHDTPLDSRFIRGLFNVYYLAVMLTGARRPSAMPGPASPPLPSAWPASPALAFALRRWLLIPRMDLLRDMIPASDSAIFRFRRLHIVGMMLNVAELATLAWALTRLGL